MTDAELPIADLNLNGAYIAAKYGKTWTPIV